jgi:hypothetical protein
MPSVFASPDHTLLPGNIACLHTHCRRPITTFSAFLCELDSGDALAGDDRYAQSPGLRSWQQAVNRGSHDRPPGRLTLLHFF